MIDSKLIKDSEYFPIRIRKVQDGSLFIDVDKIRACMCGEDSIKIEYWDGSYLEIIKNINLVEPEYLPRFLEKYPPDNWFEKDIKALEEDQKKNPELYNIKGQ